MLYLTLLDGKFSRYQAVMYDPSTRGSCNAFTSEISWNLFICFSFGNNCSSLRILSSIRIFFVLSSSKLLDHVLFFI